MSDLISRQDTIDALKKIMFTHLFECGEYIGEDTREFSIMNAEKALDVIENLPSAEPERKWIPVSEALPDEYIDVLLQFPHTMAVGYQEDGFWNIITCDDLYSGLDEEDEKPIAWMPLPEPYGGE